MPLQANFAYLSVFFMATRVNMSWKIGGKAMRERAKIGRFRFLYIADGITARFSVSSWSYRNLLRPYFPLNPLSADII